MRTVRVTSEEIERCWKFAQDIILGGNQYDRFNKSEDVQIVRTFVGKLAEYVFLHFLESEGIRISEGDMFTIYEGETNTDQYDFILPNGKTIDIKTASLPYHRRIMIPKSQFHLTKDYYVGIRLNLETNEYGRIKVPPAIATADIWGYTTREILESQPDENFGEGVCKAISLTSLYDIEPIIRMYHES